MRQPGSPYSKKTNRRAETKLGSARNSRDAWLIAGSVTGLILAMFTVASLVAVHQQKEGLNRQIADWRNKFHLSEEQAERIRQLEEEFHGRNPLFRPGRTQQQIQLHHRVLADEMNPDERAKFLETIEPYTRSDASY